MADLPKAYMNVTRALTGYWGTYLPTLKLAPGMLGVLDNGVFVKNGHIDSFKEYDPSAYPIVEQPTDDAVTRWTTKAVSMEVVGGGVAAAGAEAKVRLHFGQANEAAIICNGMRTSSYDDTGQIKTLLRSLLAAGKWDVELCLVTDVVIADTAWICFSTDRNQSADITAAAPLSLPVDPIGALKVIAGNGKLEASLSAAKTSAFCATLRSGGTPLFRAIRFTPGFLGLGAPSLGFTKGETNEFQEPAFGED
jgi:hypothetical protein